MDAYTVIEAVENGVAWYLGEVILKGGNPNARWYNITPLIAATQANSPEHIFKTLVEYGANIDLRGNGGVAPIHVARHKEAMALLIKYGADVNLLDDEERAPLQVLCDDYDEEPSEEDEELARLLIDAGARLDEVEDHALVKRALAHK